MTIERFNGGHFAGGLGKFSAEPEVKAEIICAVCRCAVPANEAILNVPIGSVDSTYRGDVCPSCWQNRSQVFVWEKNGKSIRWSVNLALALIKAEGLKPHQLMTRELAYDAMCKNDQVHELNLEHVMSANLDKPIILVRHDEPGDEGSHIIIDGWHRIAKFVEHSDRQEPLLVYLLNEEQSQRIKSNE